MKPYQRPHSWRSWRIVQIASGFVSVFAVLTNTPILRPSKTIVAGIHEVEVFGTVPRSQTFEVEDI